MDHLASDPRVCFEVDEALAYIPASSSPCEASFLFRSVILEGRARLVDDPQEKIGVLTKLTEKYQQGANLRPLTERMVEGVAVVEIVPERITGKESRPPEATGIRVQTN